LITGLAYSAAQQIIKKVTTVDIKKDEEKKPPPPPPPKPKNLPPPPVAPPVKINVAVTPPQIQTVTTPPPPAPVIVLPPPPSAPPPPRFTPKNPAAKGSPQDWVTTDDYPARALREERGGTVGFRLTIGPDGRPSVCEVTSSSGSPDLDETACTLLKRRGRFAPGTDGEGKPTAGYYSSRFKWVIPKD